MKFSIKTYWISAFLLFAVGIILLKFNLSHVHPAFIAVGTALSTHLLLCKYRNKQLLKNSIQFLKIERCIPNLRAITGQEQTEQLSFQWLGKRKLDLFLLECNVLPGLEYRSDTCHAFSFSGNSSVEIENSLISNTCGKISLGSLRLTISEDWGIYECQRMLESSYDATFYPTAYQAEIMPQIAMGRSSRSGIHRASHPGDGSELHEIREYRDGDSFRKILWSATAKTGKLTIREFAAEIAVPVHFVLNTSYFMRFGSPRMMYDQSVETALTVAGACSKTGDPFGFSLYDHNAITAKMNNFAPSCKKNISSILMKQLLQISAHNAPTEILDTEKLESEVRKLVNGRATELGDLSPTVSLKKLLVKHGFAPKDFSFDDKDKYLELLKETANYYGLPIPILQSHCKISNTPEKQLELREAQNFSRQIKHLLSQLKGNVFFIVSVRPYESEEAENIMLQTFLRITSSAHKLLVLMPDYPSFTGVQTSFPQTIEECCEALKKSPDAAIATALDFYGKQEKFKKKIHHIGGRFMYIDAADNAAMILKDIQKQRFLQGGNRYA